jgi:site-specific recombinase XerD
VTLHEARHTYAGFLMAAGYNLKQIQEYLGHADLVTTGRYIKNLPLNEMNEMNAGGGTRTPTRGL